MRTKRNRNKNKRTKKGSGVGIHKVHHDMMKPHLPANFTQEKLYTTFLQECRFDFLSSGRYGYTFVATQNGTDFGFIDHEDKEVKQFLVKVIPLDQEKEIGTYVFTKDGQYGKLLSKMEGATVYTDKTIVVLDDDLIVGPGSAVLCDGKKGVIMLQDGKKIVNLEDGTTSLGPYVIDKSIGNPIYFKESGVLKKGSIIGGGGEYSVNVDGEIQQVNTVISRFYMRQPGNDSPSCSGSPYKTYKNEYDLQKKLYDKGVETGQELCPCPMIMFDMPIKELPLELEFSTSMSFKKLIDKEQNESPVAIFVMELFKDSMTLFDLIYNPWDEMKNLIVKASTDIYKSDTYEDLSGFTVEDRYTHPCIQSILARLRRHLFSIYEKGIAHRDFSLANCLINTKGQITFIDYGMATEIGPVCNYMDDRTKLLFIINSCEDKTFVNYKWFHTIGYYDPTEVSLPDSNDLETIDEVEVAPKETIVPFDHPSRMDFTTGVVKNRSGM